MDGKQGTQKESGRGKDKDVDDFLNDQLLKSVLSNNPSKVEELLRSGADINTLGCAEKGDGTGITPLILAVCCGNEEIVEKLLQKPEILINKKDKSGQTALHKAISDGHVAALKMLLNVPGILVNEKDNTSGRTPLHLAADNTGNKIARSRLVDVFKLLLSHPDINVNIKDNYGQTPLHTSAYYGNLRIVEMLLKAGSNAEEKTSIGLTAAQWAEKQKHADVFELIVNHIKQGGTSSGNRQIEGLAQRMERVEISGEHQGSSGSVNNLNDQLLLAAKNGDLGKVKELLRCPSINVNCTDRYDKNTPLHLASEKGHLEIVQALLEVAGININAKNRDNSRLAFPIHVGDDVERHKLDIGKTALYLAVVEKHLDVIEVLVKDSRTDVNTKNKYGKSLLQVAVGDNAIEVVKILLAHPLINVNDVNEANDHFSPLHVAVERGYSEIVNMLLNHPKIDVNPKDKYYICTPLHLAARSNKLEIVEAILSHPKVNVNTKAKYDETPLHDAAEKGYLKIVQALLNANANVNAKNISGKTPLDLAKNGKHLSTAHVLQNA